MNSGLWGGIHVPRPPDHRACTLYSNYSNVLSSRGELPRDQIVVTPSLSGVGMETRQLTEENLDFASRDRYHQSSFIEADRMAHLQLN